MRILYITSTLRLGGQEKQLVDLLRGFDRSEIEAEVVVLEPGGEHEDELRAMGIHMHVLARTRLRYLSRILGVAKAARAFRPHLIHAFDPVADAYGLPGGLLAGRPVLGGFNSSTMPEWSLPAVLRFCWPWMAAVTCNAHSGSAYLQRRFGIRSDRIIVIPNGLDFKWMEHPLVPVGSLRREFNIKAGQPLIGLVGKLSRAKHPQIFVEAARHVHAVHPEAVFCALGTYSTETEDVRRLIRSHGMDDYFHLVPSRPDAPWLCAEMDIGVLSSQWEGLPNVLFEYMWWSKPCVATDVGDCAHVVQEGVTGHVVPPKDPDAFARAICSLLDDPARAAEMGRRGRERLLERYGVDQYVRGMADLYRKLCPKA